VPSREPAEHRELERPHDLGTLRDHGVAERELHPLSESGFGRLAHSRDRAGGCVTLSR